MASHGSPAGRRLPRHELALLAATVAVFVGPFLGMLILFQYVPVVAMLRDSLYDFSLLNPDRRSFVGLGNYLTLLEDPDRQQAFLVTFVFAFGVVATVIPVSFAIAIYLNGRLPARAIVRTVVFLPVVTSVVVIATMWTFLLDPANGLINNALATIGLPRGEYLTSKSQALPSIIGMMLWQQTGFATVLFLSGLQAIPRDLEDAARVDGCGPWQRIRFVVIPLLARTTVFVVVIMTVFSLQAFAPALVMTGGGPEGTTNFVAYDIYALAFQLQMPGLASAVSVVFMIIVLTISLIQMRVLRAKGAE
jgi:multiple sugar transport system permease protein/fructooligosaccharide transport system permease protein